MSTHAKHTGGDWHVGKTHDGKPCVANGTYIIAECYNGVLGNEAAEANARLIAAAPELLAALEGLVATEGKVYSPDAFHFARLMIAKAKGGAS